jgi:pyruvate dehydrogenase E2 component (dihydrolipoamide acetyltransferase)
MEEVERYIDAFRKKHGKKLTITHVVTAAIAKAIAAVPEANGVLRFNKIYLRDSIDIGVLVLTDDPKTGEIDLSSAVVRQADKISLVQQLEQLSNQISAIRSGEDKAMKKSKQTVGFIPFMLMNMFLNTVSFLMYTLNLNLSWAGMPRDPFGGAIVTSIGSLGLDTAYVPLVPYSRVPVFIAPGAVKDAAVVEDGQVVSGRVMGIHATFDHRLIDGAHAAKFAKVCKRVLANPFQELDLLD